MRIDYKDLTKEQAEEIISSVTTYKEALIKMGYAPYSSNNNKVKYLINKYNLSIEHFSNQVPNLVGQKFTKLTVREQKGSTCYCLCDCGNEIVLLTSQLTSGNNKSCGCLHSELLRERNKNGALDIKGKTSGLLVALYDTGETSYYGHIWACECKRCGKIVYYPAAMINNQRIYSCGCAKQSYGELKAENILRDNNFNYKTQYIFTDLVGDKGGPLRFNFAIFNEKEELEYLIEIDGEQHWDSKNKYYDDTLTERDKRKNEYCLKHNIPLIRIPYLSHLRNEKNITIENLKLETTPFLIKDYNSKANDNIKRRNNNE